MMNNRSLDEGAFPKESPTVGVIGLGYVGLPVAVGFAKKYDVIGFDINKKKVSQLQRHIDITEEHSAKQLKLARIEFTHEEHELKRCDFIIVAVPTPITSKNEPDLSAIQSASEMIGRQIKPYTIIVYESTVFPSTTETVCIPILEEQSNLTAGIDFHVGYSPERLNPGDQKHTFDKNRKIVSGQNNYALEKIYTFYQQVIDVDVYQAPSIQVAEAAKIVENAQRDINIAFMNELAMVFNRLNIETNEVLRAAGTKWNFYPFTPGLVGGHCIGVDSYYLIHQAMRSGYFPSILSEARKVNDAMPTYIVNSLIELIAPLQKQNELNVTVLGVSFKENIADLRNSKAIEIVNKLIHAGFSVQVCDPYVEHQGNKEELSFPLKSLDQLSKADIVILTVPHDRFAYESKSFWKKLLKLPDGIVMDIKSIIPRELFCDNTTHWIL